MTWSCVPVGELCEVSAGGTPSRSVNSYWGNGYNWLSIQEYSDFDVVTDTSEQITEDGLKNSSAKLFPEGAVIISIFATLGRVALLGKSMTTNQAIAGLVCGPKIDNRYLMYALKSKVADIEKMAGGVAQKNINLSILRNLKVPLPPLATQQHIARVLEQADQLRKQAQQMESELNQLAQSLFLEMFGDPDSNPKKWPTKGIGELASVETGSTPSRTNDSYYGGNIPWVKTGEVREEYIFSAEESITDSAIKETNCKVFPIDTVLVAMYGQGKTRGKVGVLKVPAATNQACAAILPTDALLPGFIFDFLKLRYLALRGLGRGGNQENLNLTMIKEFPIFVPPGNLQNEYLKKKSQIDKALKDNSRNMALLNDNFESLMQRAFNGELTAPERKAA